MIILLLYTFLIICFVVGLISLSTLKIDITIPQQKFSILIPFRNEEDSLETLLKSIENLEYNSDNFEILLIDDNSTDKSESIVKKWQQIIPNIHLLKNKRKSNSPKKDALQIGIKTSSFDWIITTDADCILPKNWLQAYNTIIQQQQSLFVAGPLVLENKKGFLYQYQLFDSLSLLGATLGSFGLKNPIMCNAANMGFHKTAYLQLHNNTKSNIASGDDIFTLESFVKTNPAKVHFLNTTEAIVVTKPETSWKAVTQQRIRWAAKSTHYQSIFTKLVGLLVLVTQLTLLISLFHQPLLAVFLWILKIGVDGILLFITTEKLNQKTNFWNYFPIAILYPFINTYIGIRALFGGYTWKDRVFRR
ncbi:glycosyltransferase involved in cell wall biosynthesis [Wenyingzhuangia heitensis]|uniref:Glycosyltransferase involved in cell wall biosynthesis n=1 Tax=Wenyingzhuangia heitensis TaxID=1487859 RepID=A0ABX0UGA8_9FLAO|nr:glycosyltransferase [Wenyingzhuangia heitensis]NIJ46566.1 glycosyltransferase involved in cell wall biosynthesis [Wenyingzhuangia heitensis]